MEKRNREEDFTIDPEGTTIDAILKVDEILAKIEEIKAQKGDDGKTPVKGEDYMTDAELKDLESFILSKLPKQGIDYPTMVQINKEIKKAVSQIKTIKGDKGESIKGKDGKDGNDGKDGSSDTPIQIVKKIQTIDDDKKKLQIKDINGLKDKLKKIVANENDIDSLRTEVSAIRVTIPTGMGGGASAFTSLTDTPRQLYRTSR